MNKLDKICYDLALQYAKSKLDYALAKNEIPNNKEVDNPEVAYLANSFYEAYEELRSYDSSMFYDLIDEPDI